MSGPRDLGWCVDRLAGPMDRMDAAAVSAAALVSIARSLEVIADARAQEAEIARYYAEMNDDYQPALFRPTATVESPLLMDVDRGRDHGAKEES